MTPDTILDFWFKELSSSDWWKKDERLDALIKERFLEAHEHAARGELFSWRRSARGRLAEVIALDQFSRNIFRDQPQAFATDALALVLAQEACFCGADRELDPTHRAFLYMPYMHSESRLIHEEAMKLFHQPGLEGNLEYELAHKAIIDRFGRYPHRNQILGRDSTAEEIEFLKQPGSSF